jgi:2-oxoglutarate dehydrogenase E2 component (dihydrolipoamide succinyltransferase)
MGQRVEVTLPKLGESIVGATIVKWLKKVGDPIRLDEGLVEVSTDKVNSEIPSPFAGILEEILVFENEEMEVGAPLAILLIGDLQEVPVLHETPSEKEKGDFFSPAVLRLAQMEGLSIETLRKIQGTGEGGRVSKRDIEKYLESKQQSKTAPCKVAQAAQTPPRSDEREERVKLSGMRKAIADNMVRSFYEAPHASLVVEADVTDVMHLIAKEKEAFLAAHGVKLTITSFLIQALTKALQQFPSLNASMDGETIIMKRYVNVGIAVNIEQGLVVPVIKNCQDRNLVNIAKAVTDLSTRARAGKLSPDDVKEGTVTLTNFGMTGALMGIPIIRHPEVAIIGAGTIKKKVVVREDDALAIRQMIYLTLTFDHRVIDGIYGCQFLGALQQNLESVSLH